MFIKKHILFYIIILCSASAYSQVKNDFQNQVKEDSSRRDFEQRLLHLNGLLKNGIDHLNLDSLKKDPGYYFVDRKKIENRTILSFDLTWILKDAYDQLETAGKINTLKSLRLKGPLKIIARGIANEVELPKKTNPRQSYNDFYLGVIQKLLRDNRELLKADELDFATYQSWERAAGLSTPTKIRQYRESFILFLYKHYNL